MLLESDSSFVCCIGYGQRYFIKSLIMLRHARDEFRHYHEDGLRTIAFARHFQSMTMQSADEEERGFCSLGQSFFPRDYSLKVDERSFLSITLKNFFILLFELIHHARTCNIRASQTSTVFLSHFGKQEEKRK